MTANKEKDYKELIKSFTKEDYPQYINLHLHSTFSDGKMDIYDLIEAADNKGYKYYSITDHNTMNGYIETGILDNERLIPGVEFDSWCGTVFLHMLGYGVDYNCPELKKLFAKTKRETEADWVRIFSMRHPKTIIKAIHDAGGIAVLAHPACCFVLNLDGFVKKLISYGLDGMEVYYPYNRHRGIVKFHTVKTVDKIATKYNLIKTGGTDCHGCL